MKVKFGDLYWLILWAICFTFSLIYNHMFPLNVAFWIPFYLYLYVDIKKSREGK